MVGSVYYLGPYSRVVTTSSRSSVLARILNDLPRIPLISVRHVLGVSRHMVGHVLYSVRPMRDRLGEMFIDRNHAGPDAVEQFGTVSVFLLVAWAADSDLAAPADDFDLEDRGGRHLGRHGRDACVSPSVSYDGICHGFHGPEFLGGVGHERRVAVAVFLETLRFR